MCRITFEFSSGDREDKFAKILAKGGFAWACLEVTNVCDLSCSYCYTSSGRGKNQGLPTKVFFDAIDQFAELGVRQISFVGGEPLMRSDIFQLIEHAHARGLIAHVCSNGYYIDENVAKKLKSSGASQVQLNIDHIIKEQHDKIRGKEGSFDRALKAIKHLKEAGLSVVVASLFLKQNADIIPAILELSKNLGVDGYRIWYPVTAGHAVENYLEIAPSPTDYIALIETILKRSSYYGIKKVTTIDPLLFSLEKFAPAGSFFTGCPSGRYFLTVTFDGEVLPCSGLREISAGNILSNRLEAITHSQAFEFFRSVGPGRECTFCSFSEKCKGGCIALREKDTKNKDPRCPLKAVES